MYEFTRTPFGIRLSGATFVRGIQEILKPIKEFADAYVDDMAVFSYSWACHLKHLERFLTIIKQAGLTLSLKKCKFAQSEVKFCGEIIGSGTRRADPEKVAAVKDMNAPQTKTELRRALGFFSYFREHIPDFAAIAKPLTDLTSKRVPSKIPWGDTQQKAFDKLKSRLCEATEERLHIIDIHKPFNLLVDASEYAISGILTQYNDTGVEVPVAFFSAKLNPTQRAWATVEREAYAALTALKRYRNWLFGSQVTVYSDHNPLTYITECAPKSAKLMRWALALQEYNVKFAYREGKNNVAADCLSRP